GRPRPHQRDDRPYDPFGSRKCGARTFTDWGRPNYVSVPISASEGFLHRLGLAPVGTRDDLRAMPKSGSKPKQRACHFIRLTPKGCPVVSGLLATREGDTKKLTKLSA
ncbi:MAG TPA: hypothetical protein PLW35_02025, partial [Verrucomicrobiota bacterium]|nr:hypothetical protein [Verrucomicrobiota bacterium]